MDRWAIGEDEPARGCRVDRFLADRASASRVQVRRWLERGLVRIDGQTVKRGGRTVAAGQIVELDRPGSAWIGDAGVSLDVLADGPDWVAVNKPAGTAVHPLEPDEPGTLLGAVAAAYPRIAGVGEEGELRSGVVHRLDVDTSGVMLFALDEARWASLREAFRSHRVKKTYAALVAGTLREDGAATRHLAVTRHRPAVVSVVEASHADARACSLAWRVVRSGRNGTRVDVDLHTGFLHQVRVMFAAMGHPLLGDAKYAPPDIAARAPRQMLHAAAIVVDDIAAAAPLPEDFIETQRRVEIE